MKNKEIKTVVRTTLVRLSISPQQKRQLDIMFEMVMSRAEYILSVLFQMRHESVDIRKDDGTIVQVTYKDLLRGSDPKNERILYDLIMAAKDPSRTIRGPLLKEDSRVGSKEGMKDPLPLHLRYMLQTCILPVRVNEFAGSVSLDYAAFKMACSALKSWDDRNTETTKNYKEQNNLVNDLVKDLTGIEQLEKWLCKHQLFLTRKVLAKYRRFGWDTRLRGYHLEELKKINEDVDYWLAHFRHYIETRRLEGMRPTAAFTMPSQKSVRPVQFGKNYERFSLKYEDERFTLTINDGKDSMPLRCFRTKYFRDLVITDEGNGDVIKYIFEYVRGNNSPLEENVKASLAEIFLLRRTRVKHERDREVYYMALPMNVEVPEISKNAKNWLDWFWMKDVEERQPVRAISVDLGITQPAACLLSKIEAKKRKSIASYIIGPVRDPEDMQKILSFEKKVSTMYAAMDECKEEVEEVTPFSKPWLDAVSGLAEKMRKLKKAMGQLRHYMNHTRNLGVTSEGLRFMLVYKKYVGLLKKWSYFGTNPAERGQIRKGFERHTRYLANLKMGYRKRLACEVIRLARKNGADIIIAEDLQHYRPDQEQSSRENELLMIWGKGEIKNWIQHFAWQYGIGVVFVDPRHTSQIDPETGEFGVRSKYDRTLWRGVRDGEIVSCNADILAAENLANRFFTRGTDVRFLYGKKTSGGYVITSKRKEDEDETISGKRRKQTMIQLFGSERVLLTDSGEARPLTAHKLNKMELGQEVQLYLDHGQWVTREEHRRILAELRCECYGDEIKKEKVDEGKSEEDKYQPLKNDQGL